MSDLQCAATLLIARHGEAEYETPLLMDAGGSLTLHGRAQARRLAESLRGRRVAAIYCSSMSRAVQTAEIVAAVLDLPVRVRDGLREWSVGDFAGQEYVAGMYKDVFVAWDAGDHEARIPGGESSAEIRERMSAELEAIVDQYRGETVLVISHGGAIRVAVPQFAGLSDDFGSVHDLANCDLVEAAVDGDGWVVRSWAGEPVPG